MDKNYVKSTIEGLKSTSSSRVQDTLLKIRSKVITNDSGIQLFRDCGGLECLLPHLRKPNERILDLTLSILGNCCLEDESSLAVGKLNYYGPLVSILKTVCRDSIVGRACRVIGNLAQKTSNAENLHNHGVVTALITLIESRDKNTSYPTLTMAVRAVRQLWMVPEKREEMLSLNAVRCIAILLTTECESAGVIKSTCNSSKEGDGFRKSQEELICGILKCLGYFTTQASALCAEQIQGDGRGYQCLVALTKTYESVALKCLMNLCYLSSCRPLLGTAGLVECLVRILLKNSEVSYWQKTECAARALAQLSGESVNRSRLRHCGGLPLLLAAARVSPDAMRALLQYVFDDTSFQILVSKGLISLLTDELTTFVATMDFEHNNLENNESSEIVTEIKTKDAEAPKVEAKLNTDDGKSLFMRRRGPLCSKNEDELKVVIERDNMIVGFVDAVDSDASEDSQSDEETPRRKYLKRARSRSPMTLKKKSQLIKMASKDWSAGVYWEPKSPEWPSSSRSAISPDRPQSPLSPYSEAGLGQPGFPAGSQFPASKRARLDWSPESGVGTGEGSSMGSPYWKDFQWSSGSESPNSPLSINEESSDSEISGRYSPVLCEAEGETDGAAARAELDAAQVAHGLDELIMDDDESLDDAPAADNSGKPENSKTSRIACVLVLLFRVSHGACNSLGAIREEPVSNHTLELLTGRECLNALLDYVEKCKRPLGRAARILARVLSNALCLMSILKHRLALRLHKMSVVSKHPPTKCQQCKQILRLSSKLLAQLTILAESSYGIGEISYQLLKGSSAMQQTLSITLPYIVRTEKPLKKYFIDCNALDVLFNIISDSKEDMKVCVTALSKLATNVHIKDPKSLENRFNDQICVSYDPILDNLALSDIVTFELDDESQVNANKIFLCQNSEVFSAMLMGCFKESAEKCVRLQNVTKPALEYLLTLLHLGLNNPKCDVQVFPLADKLETNLEVLLLADRFLFDKLKGLLSSAILQFQLTPETADKIYVWSLSEGMGFLCVESVAYLLTGKMCEAQRARSFSAILELEYKEQWLDDIKTMIVRQLVK
ncbi:armadillo repeat-containing protein 5 [Leguminivora glycinivorella]|uniref:armadillo repeat-containing protein 5 n=1 Tax=Leguminivora glycinivorella TaxID=1035111 RepID=UPI00200F9295|nr:armadillo repeat-containing protein 5 [Leguminivora glycinivorella]